MSTALVPYKSTKDLLAQGLYFQAWLRLACQAKRAMRRRNHFLVKNGVVMKP